MSSLVSRCLALPPLPPFESGGPVPAGRY